MRRFSHLVPLALWLAAFGCSGGAKDKIVLYAAGDSIFSRKIIEAFTKKTGIEVETAADAEINRGIKHRMTIEKERGHPRGDVFWNNELVNTIILKQKGLLAPYKSPSAVNIPKAYADPEGYWTAFGARARVFLVNTDLVKPEDMPKSMYDMLLPKWRGKVGIAKPLGGTTATHAAALFVLLGDSDARKFYAGLRKNGVVLCDGNGHVKTQVANGELHWGWTDTNDSNIAIRDGKPVKVVYPDQEEGGIGTLLIPHSVSMIKNGPHPENARKFIDFLLGEDTERRLAHSLSVQIPVRKGVEWSKEAEKNFVMDITKIRSFNHEIDWNNVADRLVEVIRYLDQNFVR